MEKWYVIGYKGRVGTELIKRGCNPLDCDITNVSQIKDKIIEYKPNVIINCAGKTDVDFCEKDTVNTYLVNAFAPRWVIENFTGTFVQLSTDFIFDGKSGPYDENAIPSPQSVYGFSKHFCEVGLRKFHNSLVIRTTNLYDVGPKSNFVLWILDALKNEKYIKVTTELSGNPTYVPHLVDGIIDAINKKVFGTLNIAGDKIYNRYEFAKLISDVFILDDGLISPTKSNIEFIAKRPKLGGFILDKAKSLNIPIYSVEDGLKGLKSAILRK